jgi:hypothetical protein
VVQGAASGPWAKDVDTPINPTRSMDRPNVIERRERNNMALLLLIVQ